MRGFSAGNSLRRHRQSNALYDIHHIAHNAQRSVLHYYCFKAFLNISISSTNVLSNASIVDILLTCSSKRCRRRQDMISTGQNRQRRWSKNSSSRCENAWMSYKTRRTRRRANDSCKVKTLPATSFKRHNLTQKTCPYAMPFASLHFFPLCPLSYLT